MIELDMNRVNAFVTLMNLCRAHSITVAAVTVMANGFQIKFEDWEEGDAILHDGSYGRSQCMWETYGFPWDDGDVSVHTSEKLIALLTLYKIYGDNYDWSNT